MREQLEESLEEMPYEFRIGRGTRFRFIQSDQLVKELLEQDMEKAIDRIIMENIWIPLEKRNVNKDIVLSIKYLYQGRHFIYQQDRSKAIIHSELPLL